MVATLMWRLIEILFTFHTFVLLFALFVTAHFLKKAQRKKLNEPPLVKYKYPIIGHTQEYVNDVDSFIAKCRAEYGSIFSIYVHGRVVTVVGKDHAHEIFLSKNCSFEKGFLEISPVHEILGMDKNFKSIVGDIVSKTLMKNVDVYSHHFQVVLHEKVEEVFGDHQFKQVDSPLEFAQDIVAKTMAASILGEDAKRNPELMTILFEVSRVIGETWFIPNTLSYIHPYLHKLRILWTVRRDDIPRKSLDQLIQLIKPIVDYRLKEKERLGDMWEEPVDLLSGMINDYNTSNVNYKYIACTIILMVFAAVHATSAFGAKSLIDYAFSPKCWQELFEEQVKVNPENKKIITNEETNQMEKMDSFIKETLRVTGVVLDMYHMVLESGFQFSNGYQLPPGRLIAIDKESVHFDPTNTFGNPSEFDGSRYIGKESPSTKIGRTYIAFGLGKHVCPGRYFAIFEIKLLMAHLVRNFMIKSVSGTRIKSLNFSGFIVPFGKLIFEKRVKQ